VNKIGAPASLSAIMIGVPNLSAIFMAALHCSLIPRESVAHRVPQQSIGIIRSLFIASSSFGVLGNVLHVFAVKNESIWLAIVGRFVIGLASAEILNRQYLNACLPSHFVIEAARLMRYRVLGTAAGLLLGSVADMIQTSVNTFSVWAAHTTSWLMALLWFTHLVRVCVQCRRNNGGIKNNRTNGSNSTHVHDTPDVIYSIAEEVGSNIDILDNASSGSDQSALVSSSSSSDDNNPNPLHATYGTSNDLINETSKMVSLEEASYSKTPIQSKRVNRLKAATRIRKLMAYHICIPISLVMLAYSSFGLEVFFSSTPLITQRYFGWSGACAALYLSLLTTLILPVNFACAQLAKRYEERTVLKVSSFVCCMHYSQVIDSQLFLHV
jgi:hypothetical protein